MTHFIIGCGGVGSWLVAKLVKVPDVAHRLWLVDGDTLTEENLDRQLFPEEAVGRNKAEALAGQNDLACTGQFFHEGMVDELLAVNDGDILWCCADNHACRRAVLNTCDRLGCWAIFGANEYTDAEAYIYDPAWSDTGNDPRRFYSDILTDHTGDPTGPQGCTGLAAEASPQLVLANDMASSLMLSLWWFWFKVAGKELPWDTVRDWPVHHKSNPLKVQTIKFGDRQPAGTIEPVDLF